MQHYSVRKVKVAGHLDQQDSWRDQMKLVDTETLRLRISAWVSPASPVLVRWGGLASMAGGALWIVLFLLLYVESLLSFNVNIKLLAIPPLLFLVGLVGLLARLWRNPGGLGNSGFVLSALGMSSICVLTFNMYRYDGLYSIQGMITNYLFGPPPPALEWFLTVLPGLFISSTGLVFLGIATIRTRVLPVSLTLWMVVSSWALFLSPVIAVLLATLLGPQSNGIYSELLSGVITGLSLPFGASWIWLGDALLSERQNDRMSVKPITD